MLHPFYPERYPVDEGELAGGERADRGGEILIHRALLDESEFSGQWPVAGGHSVSP